jgi:hypothetical protein
MRHTILRLTTCLLLAALHSHALAKARKGKGKGKKAPAPKEWSLKGTFLQTGKEVKFVPVPGTEVGGKTVWSFKIEPAKLNAYLKSHKGLPKNAAGLAGEKRYHLRIRAPGRVVGDGVNLKPQKPGDHRILELKAVK